MSATWRISRRGKRELEPRPGEFPAACRRNSSGLDAVSLSYGTDRQGCFPAALFIRKTGIFGFQDIYEHTNMNTELLAIRRLSNREFRFGPGFEP